MIRREEGDLWFLIAQPDHARLSGEMAAQWKGCGRPVEDELIFVAANHDTGWEEWEASPSIHPPTGAPAHFLEVSASVNLNMWRGGIDRLLKRGHPYAALLVSHHAAAIYRRGVSSPQDSDRHRTEVGLFLREEEERQGELMRRLASEEGPRASPERVQRDLRLLQVWDLLSLMVCNPWRHIEAIPDVPWSDSEERGEAAPSGGVGPFREVVDRRLRQGHPALFPSGGVGPFREVAVTWEKGGGIGLRPYPFFETPAQFGVEARSLPARSLPSDQALQEALARARRETLTFTFFPA